jgi:hypothetical protein
MGHMTYREHTSGAPLAPPLAYGTCYGNMTYKGHILDM